MEVHRPKISIIVPLYNCGKGNVIANLITDVEAQTEQSWELLLCNDGSSDNTLVICNDLKSRDSRIKVIDNPHKGVSATRNSGLENATGEWVTFVDADDHLTGCFLDAMLTSSERNSTADMVCCSYSVLYGVYAEINLYSDSCWKGKAEMCRLFEETDFLKRCSPWARMFRRDIITKHKIRFNEQLSHSEDRLFVYNYLQHVGGIATTSSIGYIYESFSGSSLKHKKHSFEMLLLRQKELTRAAVAVIDTFGIRKEANYNIVNNLLTLLMDGAQSIILQNRNRKETEEQQTQLLDATMQIGDLLSDKRITNRIADKKLSYLLSRNFKQFNSIIRRREYILEIKRGLRRILGIKMHSSTYSDYVHKLN